LWKGEATLCGKKTGMLLGYLLLTFLHSLLN
jgi:hypothetical protein